MHAPFFFGGLVVPCCADADLFGIACHSNAMDRRIRRSTQPIVNVGQTYAIGTLMSNSSVLPLPTVLNSRHFVVFPPFHLHSLK